MNRPQKVRPKNLIFWGRFNILASFFCTSANLVAKDTQLFSFKQQFWQYQRKGQHHCLNDGINHKYQSKRFARYHAQ